MNQDELRALPGGALVLRGLADLGRGELSAAALTVSLAPTRLARLGVPLPELATWPVDRERALYETLAADPKTGDAYYRYNALKRELDSFMNALEHRRPGG